MMTRELTEDDASKGMLPVLFGGPWRKADVIWLID
jgi:hypothetical protein